MCIVRPFPSPVASFPVSAPPTAGTIVSGSAQKRTDISESFWPRFLRSFLSPAFLPLIRSLGQVVTNKVLLFKAGRIGPCPFSVPWLVARSASWLQITFWASWTGAAAAGWV